MEPWGTKARLGRRRRVGTRQRRRPGRFGWCGSCARELGTTHGTVRRVADQIGCGVESLRTWVQQSDIDDGVEPGLSSDEAKRIRELEQENRELRRANDLLKRASA